MQKWAKMFSRIDEIPAREWNGLALRAAPMLEFEYFHALEKSGSISTDRGYSPAHLGLYDGSEMIAIVPLYLRDRAWVEFGDGGLIEFLSQLTGLPFGLGLVGNVPYTPVPGYDFLIGPRGDGPRLFAELLDKIDEISKERGLSTARFYFVAPESMLHSIMVEHGYLRLSSPHLLWINRGYRSFDDFLLSFKSSRRTKIKREWRSVRNSGIDLRMVQGLNAPASFYQDLHQLYKITWTKYMGPGIRPLLNESFFTQLAKDFSHRCSFSVAETSGKRIAMALFYNKAEKLYGRYWGSFREIPFLHFAACYYYPIAYAIENGIGQIDPGFGGEHKTLRGFEDSQAYHYLKFFNESQRRIAYAVFEQMRSQLGSK
ncbi:MAG TPA: GNAT family N-acetyltransferase [Syntrophobacteraceae bacterium]|nr:GNAT family N-acetyltransferase [Syntrophobacteraceae bacterium]